MSEYIPPVFGTESVSDYLRAKYGDAGPPFPGRPDPLAPPVPRECKPDNTVLLIDPDTLCRTQPWPGAPICGKPGVLRMFLGCEHEHLAYADLCKEHQVLTNWVHWCSVCHGQMKVVKTEPI